MDSWNGLPQWFCLIDQSFSLNGMNVWQRKRKTNKYVLFLPLQFILKASGTHKKTSPFVNRLWGWSFSRKCHCVHILVNRFLFTRLQLLFISTTKTKIIYTHKKNGRTVEPLKRSSPADRENLAVLTYRVYMVKPQDWSKLSEVLANHVKTYHNCTCK